MSSVALDDIQGFIIRALQMPALRVFVLKVETRHWPGGFSAALVSGDSSVPKLTTAAPWAAKPEVCVNIGFTHAGLAALGLAGDGLASFPEEFAQGAVSRAARVGDVGQSAPEHWKKPLADADVHALLFVFAQAETALETASERLRAQFAPGLAFSELAVHDGRGLPGNVAHFGYRDGFSQPAIEGATTTGRS